MITGDDFIALAGRLAANPRIDEATLRTAISRAYYGAFHLVCQFLSRSGVSASHNHGVLQHWLKESGHAQAHEAGVCLTSLHHARIRADYELAHRDPANPRYVQGCVEAAADLQLILRELDTPEDRQQIKDGIEAYRRRIGPRTNS